MIRLATISLSYDGDTLRTRWHIPTEARDVGLRAAAGGNRANLGWDVGTPDGTSLVGKMLENSLAQVLWSFRQGWREPSATDVPLF